MFEALMGFVAVVAALAFGAVALLVAFALRRVVPPNMVHVVQSKKKRTIYGANQPAGNVYYQWPAFIPLIGVVVSRFAISNFKVELQGYTAYDVNRVPFVTDVVAFFHIYNSDMAAQRVSSFEELMTQLQEILRGAVRRTLAAHKLEEILGMRAELGKTFTAEVDEQLKEWGVSTVKMIEFMNMSDAQGYTVIQDIMAKDQSRIERESRTVVADNNRLAETAEIEAEREIDLRKQDALQQVGQRTAEQEKAVGIAKEKAQQEVLSEQRSTTEREMEVQRIRDVKTAEIAKDVATVAAEQEKQVSIVKAEGQRQETEIVATGDLVAAQREAEGIKAKGLAEAEAKKAMELAPVSAQIELAREIGGNEGYQTYLVRVRQIEAAQAVGIEQAGALKAADIKVIANGGTVSGGLDGVGALFSSAGGQAIGAMLEGLSQTPVGEAVVEKMAAPKKAAAKPKVNGEARA